MGFSSKQALELVITIINVNPIDNAPFMLKLCKIKNFDLWILEVGNTLNLRNADFKARGVGSMFIVIVSISISQDLNLSVVPKSIM